tara:strand:+ start:359 stop:1132 length:774 start_codon:yes stop_codon:yes gene_type:complete
MAFAVTGTVGIIAAASAGAAVIGSTIGAISSGKQARKARLRAKQLTGELEALEKNRQDIINPYSGVKDLSSYITDVSGMASNPYAMLGVATQAAEMQVEEADIALANTLDTIRATGSGAGGATALAQAALQSKKGVAASIEQQEAANEKLKAQGEANLQNIKMSEAQRVQGALMGEQGRLQQADVAGQQFVFGQRENREMQQLNRKQAQITGQEQQQAAYNQAQAGYIGAGVSAIGNFGTAAMGAVGLPAAPGTTTT